MTVLLLFLCGSVVFGLGSSFNQEFSTPASCHETSSVSKADALLQSRVVRTQRDEGNSTRGEGVKRFIVHLADSGSDASLRVACESKESGLDGCVLESDIFGGGAAALPFVVVRGTKKAVEALVANDPNLDFSELDATTGQGPAERDEKKAKKKKKEVPWGLDRIDSRGRQSGLDSSYAAGGPLNRGRAAHAYVVDTGILNHHEFGQRLVPTLDMTRAEDDDGTFECGINGLEPEGPHSMACGKDSSGHGTHSAGIIGGELLGVARRVTLHAIKVVSNKNGRASQFLAALYWIACCGERPAVASLSVASSWGQLKSYHRAVDALVAAGVTVVVPAGNVKRGDPADACDDFLAHEKALSVAASGKTKVKTHYFADYFADFSNYGKCVDILAPGVSILTTSSRDKSQVVELSGTSVASAHAAGAVALLLGSGDVSSPEDVVAKLVDKNKGTHRRRREPPVMHRRRRVEEGTSEKHRGLDGTPDRVLFVKGGTGYIHRRRSSSRRSKKDKKATPQERPAEAPPTKKLAGVPIHGPSQEGTGQWIVNFALPPPGFEFFPASYSATLAADFCDGLSGAAACTFRGRPRDGGVPFAALTASEEELAAAISASPHRIDFVEADVSLTASPTPEAAPEPEDAPGPLPQAGRRRRGLSWGLDRVDSLYGLDGAYLVPRRGGFRDFGGGVNVTAHAYVVGTGVRVGHRDFAGRATAALDLSGGCLRECTGSDKACAEDKHGQGTHVAAVVAGAKFGVAKMAGVHAVKVFGDEGKGMVSWVVAALDWISRRAESPSVAVLNFEKTGLSKSLQRAVDFANLVGLVTVIVGAGDSGAAACESYPSNIRTTKMGGAVGAGTIAVAATTRDDTFERDSNYGKCVDFLAPGSGILTASHEDDSESTLRGGTAMASAHAAGAVALLLAAERAVDPDTVRTQLYLASYRHKQMDFRTPEEKTTRDRFIYVRDAAEPPAKDKKAETCYDCKFTKSGCPCMKEWEYDFDGKTHKCTDYCCNPYDDPKGSYCRTQSLCTVRVEGREPARKQTDYCDSAPGRRLSGGWVDSPHIYPAEDGPVPAPPPPEDECGSHTTSPSPVASDPGTESGETASGEQPETASGKEEAEKDDDDEENIENDKGEKAVEDDGESEKTGEKGGGNEKEDHEGEDGVEGELGSTPPPEAVVKRLHKNLDCLEQRLAGEPCDDSYYT